MTDVLVVGAGSIGARHARNLSALGAAVTITDADGERARSVALDIDARSVPFTPSELGDHPAVVIASPTSEHASQAATALAGGAYVLIEKPAATTVDGLDVIEQASDRVMVGYNLRLHEPVERLLHLVRDGRIGNLLAVRLWFGSWLPDWRPGVDYRTTYSARSDLGGGVLLDAIHELDLLLWIAGDARFKVIGSVVARVGPLEIDVEDTVRTLLRHDDGWVASVELDYLSRRYRRGIEIVGSHATARLDWARAVVELDGTTDSDSWPATTPVDASYVREAERFLAFVETGTPPPVDGVEGCRSLRLADAIRTAAR